MKRVNGEEIRYGLFRNAKKSTFGYEKTRDNPNAEKHLK